MQLGILRMLEGTDRVKDFCLQVIDQSVAGDIACCVLDNSDPSTGWGEGTNDDQKVCFDYAVNHLGVDAEEDQVRGTRVLHHAERHGRAGEDNGEAKGGGDHVYHAAHRRTEGRGEAIAPPATQTPSENVEHPRPRRHGEEGGGGQEQHKTVGTRHRSPLSEHSRATIAQRNGC